MIEDPPKPRLELDRGVGYQHVRNQVESSLFGTSAGPLRIGRFTVLHPIGDGGMGSVYAAYDNTLDRKVAIKVLHGAAREDTRPRILREARALARFSHPNIVTVHEVGEHHGQVFLAMEFVRGQSLAAWIQPPDSPRPWREILGVFRQAGEGLAAAHEAGLVHRDFKPANVVVDETRVKVLDFGLAFPATDDRPPTTEYGEAARSGPSSTTTGELAGTPAYMAPEQLRAQPATAASDQFAFCLCLYEALYGQRPFEGQRLAQLALAVCEGRPRRPPPDSKVPTWVRAIVGRGLSRDPADRFESMRTLLDALARDPAVVRRRVGLGAGLVVLAVASGVGLAAVQHQPAPSQPPCAGIAAALDDTWGPSVRTNTQDGFLASEAYHAAQTWPRVESALDDYAQRWIAGSTDACQAHTEGRQSGPMFDRRTVCLESRRVSLQAAVTQLAGADAGVAARALEIVAGLPSLAHCADLEALTALVPPPDDPTRAHAVAELRAQLAIATVQEDAGHFERAIELAQDAVDSADALEYAPLRAEARLALGRGLMETAKIEPAEAMLADALHTALAAGHHPVAIEALARRIYVRAELLRLPATRTRDDEAIVRALLQRAPADAHLRWLVANNLAVMHSRANEPQRAEALYQEALEHARSRGDAGRKDALVVRSNRAKIAFDREDLVTAEREGNAALTAAEQLLGPEHPHLCLYLVPVANALLARGQQARARALLERSLAIRERSGPLSLDAAEDLYMLAEIARTRRDHAHGRRLLERGLTLVRDRSPYHECMLLHARGDLQIDAGDESAGLADHRRALVIAIAQRNGPDDPNVAISHGSLGEALVAAGRWEQAEQQLERATAILDQATIASDSALRVPDLLRWGELHLAAGRPAQAQAMLERALRIQRAGSPQHPALATIHASLGDAHRRLGALGPAREAYEAAVRLTRAQADDDHPALAEARFALADVLRRCTERGADCGEPWDAREAMRRAEQLADTAAATYGALGETFADERHAVQTWRRVTAASARTRTPR